MVEYITHCAIKHKAHNSGERGGGLWEDKRDRDTQRKRIV